MNDEVERMVTASFLLGLRISQSINNLPPPDRVRYAALIETLEAVAAGEDLMLEAAADLQRVRSQQAEFDSIQRDYADMQRLLARTVLEKLLASQRG